MEDSVSDKTSNSDNVNTSEKTTCDNHTMARGVSFRDSALLSLAAKGTIVKFKVVFSHGRVQRVIPSSSERLQWTQAPPAEISWNAPPHPSSMNHIQSRQNTLEDQETELIKKRRGRTTQILVRGDWNILPRNLGKLVAADTTSNTDGAIDNKIAESAVTVSVAATNTSSDSRAASVTCDVERSVIVTRYNLRSGKAVIHQSDIDRVAQKLAVAAATRKIKIAPASVVDNDDSKLDSTPSKKRRQRSKTTAENVIGGIKAEDLKPEPKKKARRTKDNPYGLTPGETPFPNWVAPSVEQCQEVYTILVKMHGDVKTLPPDEIPTPSLDVAGCGEVPSVLDGLIRTVLSGSTTFESANKMLKALVARFGILEEAVGKGSVNWNKVRIAPYDDLYAQLKEGGLGKIKAKHIQGILTMVYAENMKRHVATLEDEKSRVSSGDFGIPTETESQTQLEIPWTEQEMLSLEHMRGMEAHEAVRHFVRYPGVGVKTAACVTLFSLQQPCFAVDTHVFRMSRWLKWVPQKSNEDDAFNHLEVRCPDKLKYGLHQLFIHHGKTCHRCNDKSFIGTDAWNDSECPLERLVDRYTKRIAKPKEVVIEKKARSRIKNKGKGLVPSDNQDMGLFETGTEEARFAGDISNAKVKGVKNNMDSKLSELDEADVVMQS